MLLTWLKRLALVLVATAIAGGFWYAMREQPLLVDLATVSKGPMQVTIDEEGVARVRNVYTVSTPIAGELGRTTLREGDAVKGGETVIASIRPPDPPFIDERTLGELNAAISAARSGVAMAKTEAEKARSALALAQSEFRRAATLLEKDFVAPSRVETAQTQVKLRENELAAAQAAIAVREAELASAQARIAQPGRASGPDVDGCCIPITAPVDGVVLKVIARSEQAVAAGAPVAEIGDPSDLEISVDLLSADAVKLSPGMTATITEWGGERDLQATIRRIEPAAFTKVSALGISEQRVNALLDLAETPAGLGHGYRVIARIALWSGEEVLQAPIGALFRSGGSWAVFVARDRVAQLRLLEIGRVNRNTAQVLSGLNEGETVVLYPSDQLEDGRIVSPRD